WTSGRSARHNTSVTEKGFPMQQLRSKKFRALILAILTVLGSSQAGEPWYVTVTVGAAAVGYILAQGWADQGKEAVKIVESIRGGRETMRLVQAIERGKHIADDATERS